MKNLIEDLAKVIDVKAIDESEERVDLDELGQLLDEAAEAEKTIKALGDTDYKDKEAYFKMVELLKGLAVASEKDETAKKYLSAVSDALTKVSNDVLGEDADEV